MYFFHSSCRFWSLAQHTACPALGKRLQLAQVPEEAVLAEVVTDVVGAGRLDIKQKAQHDLSMERCV